MYPSDKVVMETIITSHIIATWMVLPSSLLIVANAPTTTSMVSWWGARSCEMGIIMCTGEGYI